jgi:diguanylate cyclase (GGDEF)-like protein
MESVMAERPRWRERLRWRRDEVVATLESTNPAVVARAFVYLFGLGALLVQFSPALPGEQLRHLVLAEIAVALALATSIAVTWSFDRTPAPVMRVLPSLGTALVTLVLFAARTDTIPAYALLYFWVVLAGFYFFGRRDGLVHLVGVMACLAAVLGFRHVEQGTMLAVMSLGTLGVTGVMLALLRERADTLILSLDSAARTDALTGVLNRRAFDERLADELARVERTRRPLSLLVFDVDGFKDINDRLGHNAGDRLLEDLAATLHAGRQTDVVGRLGGDEFALLLPETDGRGAARYAARTLEALEDDDSSLRVSVGIASWPADGRTADELLEASDCAMYAAKRAGGGCALPYEPAMGRTTSPA